jgi:hypothetical protein
MEIITKLGNSEQFQLSGLMNQIFCTEYFEYEEISMNVWALRNCAECLYKTLIRK